jgi:LmbE family N-acetylglucosaminyl deacetylase
VAVRGGNGDLGDPTPRRVLVIAAHPDDIDFDAAGTVARLAGAGVEVVYCIATDGDAGVGPEGSTREAIAALRRAEQEEAARAVGVSDVRFLGLPDGRLEPTLALRSVLTGAIRDVRPDVTVLPCHEWRWDRFFANHPDHHAVGLAGLYAVYPDARTPSAHPELLADGLEPHVVEQLWVWGHAAPNHFVDVTDTLDRKLAALRAHRSQTDHFDDLEGLIRRWAEAAASDGGLAPGRLAESFLVRRTG